MFPAQPTEDHLSIGDRGLLTAKPVSCRTRTGTGTLGTYSKATARIDLCDRASASSDCVDVYHGRQNRITSDSSISG